MFGFLFLKECKAISKSIIYFVFIVVTILFYWSDLAGNVENNIKNHNNPTSITEHSENPLVKPIPEQEYYGAKHAEVPEQIIPDTILTLLRETRENSYTSYPFGFYKNVKLNNSELKKVKSIIQELTGISYDDANELLHKNVYNDETYLKSESEFKELIKNSCDYETFKEKMLVIEKIIGKNSNYSYGFYKEKSVTNLSYEEALKEYNDFV